MDRATAYSSLWWFRTLIIALSIGVGIVFALAVALLAALFFALTVCWT